MINIGEQKKSVSNAKWVGYATMKVIAVNPTEDEIDAIIGRPSQRTPNYTGCNDGVDYARIDFWLAPEDEASGIPPIKYSIFLSRTTLKSKSDKTKVIDIYGNTAWVTSNEYSEQAIPLSSAGKPLAIIPPYEVCCKGQDQLVEFLRAWANLPGSLNWNEETRSFSPKPKEQLAKAECKLEQLKKYWSGDFSEITSLLVALKDYTIKCLLVIKKVNIGRSVYNVQDVFPKVVPSWQNTSVIEREVNRRKENGLLSNFIVWNGDAKVFEEMPEPAQQTPSSDSWFVTTPQEQAQPADTPVVVSQKDIDELPF